jgi:hypothetical protein
VKELDDFELGRTKLTILSTINPNKKFVIPEMIITAYCIAWDA